VQYFERAVFESHPENKAPYDVLLSQLGTFRHDELYKALGPRPADRWPVYRVPGMDQVKVQTDVTYKMAEGAAIKLDVYHPADQKDGEHRPAVLFGGAKAYPQWTGWGHLLAASGLVVVTYDLRLPPSASKADALSDANDLIAYVRANADALGVDKDRLALFGVSTSGRYSESAVMKGTPAYIGAIVSYYGPLDDEDTSVSPLEIVRSQHGQVAPMLIANAGHMDTEIEASIERFVAEAKVQGVSLQYLVHGEAFIGFDLSSNDNRSRQIIAQTVDFLKQHLSAK
jgi:acetyl esterase/lipase